MKLVFVSSTFKDMQFERDRLHSHVVPQIDARLSMHGESVYFGDLRWGVNTSGMEGEDSSKKVLDVCLDEIDGCKPYMIVLIGERYGWIPEERLIRQAAVLKGIDVPSDISVTQLEIEYGALLRPDLEGRIMFYFRQLDTTGMTEEELRDYKGESPLHTQKIAALKKRIQQIYPNQVRTYTARWNKETKSVVELDGLMANIQADLERVFLADIQKENSIPWQQRAMNAAAKHYLEEAKHYYPVVRVPQHSVGSGPYASKHHHLSIISGEIGSGKSAFVANKYYRHTLHPSYADKKCLVPFVFGLDEFSSNPQNLAKLVLFAAESALGLKHTDISPDQPLTDAHVKRLLTLEKRLKDTPLAIFVDNCTEEVMSVLARLYQNKDGWNANYPFDDPYVHKYYVADNGSELGSLTYPMFDYARRYVTRPLTQSERRGFVGAIVKAKHKELSAVVIEHIVGKRQSANPFYVKLVVDRLLMLDSHDFAEIRRMGDGMDAINNYMISIVDNIADDVEGIVQELANEAAQRIDYRFVCRFLSVLSCSEGFLQEEEIKQIFAHQGWEYTSLNMALTTKTLSGFLTVRPSERKYRIVNDNIARYLRKFVWQQGYQDTAKIMATFAKNQPQNTNWYKRAFAIAVHAQDAPFAAQIFNEIYLAKHDASLHRTIQNTLCKQVCHLLKNAATMDGVAEDGKTLSRNGVNHVVDVLFNITTSAQGINYTPLLKYVFAWQGGNKQNTSTAITLMQVKKRFDQAGIAHQNSATASFYQYICSLIARIMHKTMMETSYFLQEANKTQKGYHMCDNYRMISQLALELHYLERGVYPDVQAYLDSHSKDPSKYFYFDDEVANEQHKQYVNTVQKGHAYHMLYKIFEQGEQPDYDLIDKALLCYKNIDWNCDEVLKFLTIDDIAQIVRAFMDSIHSYNPTTAKAKIAKLKQQLPFYLQKAREIFETDSLDCLVPQILVCERMPTDPDDDTVEKLSDLHLRAINRQQIADHYMEEVFFDQIISMYTGYLQLFEEYLNFDELQTQAENMVGLLTKKAIQPLQQTGTHTPDNLSMTLTKHFFSIVTLLDRLEKNQSEQSINIMLGNFFAAASQGKKPLITQIIVTYFLHRYLPFDQQHNYGKGKFGVIRMPKEQTLAMLAKLFDLYDSTNGGNVRVIAIATAEAEVRLYKQIVDHIREDLFAEEEE